MHHLAFLRSYLSLMVDYIKSLAITTTYTKPFYAPSMHRIIFTSDWLEPYTCSKSLSLYLSGREELKGRLYKLSVQVYKSDCAYD